MIDLTYKLSDMIRNDAEFDEILSKAIEQISLINDNKLFGSKRASVGNFFLTNHLRGQEYLEKYKKKIEEQSKDGKNLIPKSNKEYKDANTCLITIFNDKEVIIWYGRDYFSNITNISLAKEEYNKLKKIEKPSVDDINRSCATIQWLIAQECPFARGNDSIANVITKSIYHSYGIKISPLKAATSLDFEAFYRDLDDYIANYPSFFEKAPQ